MERARRLLVTNEPELAAALRTQVEVDTYTPAQLGNYVKRITGRRDTGNLAYWYARAVAAEVKAHEQTEDNHTKL